MLPGIEAHYQTIAKSMVDAIPEEWKNARFEAIFYEGSSNYEAEYIRAADGKARSFQPTDEGDRAFRQLRKLFKEAGKPVWGRATFELHGDGTFRMQWGYGGCDEQGNTLFDEDEELKRLEARHQRLTSE